MNILVGTSSPIDRGSGINTYVREIVAALRLDGHTVTIAGPQASDLTWLEEHNVSLLPLSELMLPEHGAREIVRMNSSKRIDAIINNDNPYVQSVAPLIDCSFLSIMHLGYRNIASLACFNHSWVDYVVAISNEMRFQAISKYRVPASKVAVVYNGIADPTTAKPRTVCSDDNLKIVFSGGDNRRKGFDLLLDSIVRFPNEWENCELKIFGEVHEKYARRLRGAPFVTLPGRIPRAHMLSELADADVFLLPSRFEGCPMALIEAMAFGLVPIVSDGEGAMDVMVQSGVSGFVCQLTNWTKQMLECLHILRTNPGLRLQMHRQARARYESRFQSKVTIEQLLSLIASPTVDRSLRVETIDLLDWHRPAIRGVPKSDILQRLRIRIGILKHRNRTYPIANLLK